MLPLPLPILACPAQLTLNPLVVTLLVSGADANAGDLNPAVLTPGVTLIIRMTIVYTDNNPANDPNPPPLVFEVIVEPEDWIDPPCSYLEVNCKVFENNEMIMFAPNAPGGFATLSLFEVAAFSAQSDVNVVSTTCDVRCQAVGECGGINALLEPSQAGIPFGTPVQSGFNNGFCNPVVDEDRT